MTDWLGLAIIGCLLVCALFGLAQLGRPYNVSTEEFEKRAREGPGLLGAGLLEIQKLLDPSVDRASEVQEDLKRGRYNGEQGSGDGPEAGNPGSNKT